jgi:hypothetical protein
MKSQDIAYGYAIGYNDGIQGGGGGDNDDWQPPSWWDLPDPSAKQVVMLLDTSLGLTVEWSLDGYDGTTIDRGGTISINWGDGSTGSVPSGDLVSSATTHTYTTAGMYTVIITGDGTATQRNTMYYPKGENNTYIKPIIAIKIGSGIKYSYSDFSNMTALMYINLGGIIGGYDGSNPFYFYLDSNLRKIDATIFPTEVLRNCFISCISLQNCDLLKNCAVLPQSCFAYCCSLKKLELPACVSMESGAIVNCYSLKSLKAPLMTDCANTNFIGCAALSELTYAQGCNFNGNTFTGCYSLENKPT